MELSSATEGRIPGTEIYRLMVEHGPQIATNLLAANQSRFEAGKVQPELMRDLEGQIELEEVENPEHLSRRIIASLVPQELTQEPDFWVLASTLPNVSFRYSPNPNGEWKYDYAVVNNGGSQQRTDMEPDDDDKRLLRRANARMTDLERVLGPYMNPEDSNQSALPQPPDTT